MNGGGRAFVILSAGDPTPGLLVELHIETRQHDRAMWKLCDCRKQLCGCWHRPGGAGGDHWLPASGKSFYFCLDQEIAPCGGINFAHLVEALRPIGARDLEKVESELPILVKPIGNETIEPPPIHLARDGVVDQPGKIVGEGEGGGRRVCDQRRSLLRANRF